jgi:AcrR family transcriptional regulator
MPRPSAKPAAAGPSAALLRLPVPERLLAVAVRLFAEQGFEGTSVQEIVAAAGVTKGAMYHYFASKDDLLYAIYHRLLSLQTERLNALADGPGDAADRVRAVAEDVVETTLTSVDEAIVFFRSMHMLPSDKRTRVRAERRRYHERFRALVEEGQRAGTFRDDVSADIVTHFFYGAVNQLGTWYHRDGGLNLRQVAVHYADMLLGGLVKN